MMRNLVLFRQVTPFLFFFMKIEDIDPFKLRTISTYAAKNILSTPMVVL